MSKYKLVLDTTTPDDADNVAAAIRDASGNLVTSTDAGGGVRALDVNLAAGSGFGIYNEDDAHTTADPGQAILAVRNDTEGTLVSADGDYANLQLDAVGRLRVLQRALDGATDSVLLSDGTNDAVIDASGRLAVLADIDLTGDLVGDDEPDTEDPLKVGSRAIDGALTAVSASGDKANQISDMYRRVYTNNAPNIGMSVTLESVGTTVGEIVSSPLAGRTRIIVQNRGNKSIAIGQTGITFANGLEIAPGGYFQSDWGEDVNVFAIADSGTQSVAVMEVA